MFKISFKVHQKNDNKWFCAAQLKPQELDVIIFLFFLSLALLRYCKNRRTDTVQLLK